MNKHLLRGDQLIQCYLDSKNHNDNWVTLSYVTSYYYMNRSWQLAKSCTGLGNAKDSERFIKKQLGTIYIQTGMEHL